jgi:hypothetical protein
MSWEKLVDLVKNRPTDLVAGAILVAGFLRIVSDGISKRLDNTTLLYLCAAAAVFLLKKAKTFKFGDLEVQIEQVKEQIGEAKLLAGIAEDNSKVSVATISKPIFKSLKAGANQFTPGTHPDDPWKGVFGGKNIDKEKGRALSAEVKAIGSSPGWYGVTLKVITLPGFTPLKGDVQFFIHDTFLNNKPVVQAVSGTALLRLKAWGAFTVGVLADEGETMLELDLAELESAPMDFRSK